MTYAGYEAYEKCFQGFELVPTDNIVEQQRGIKDEREQAHIRRAIEITERLSTIFWAL
ncbi:hypothetical protein HMSSN036_13590 [Paenibacillus macerans]|nr:hypothetical protein HMSSN036_13590 [Paenibacillus macerans]